MSDFTRKDCGCTIEAGKIQKCRHHQKQMIDRYDVCIEHTDYEDILNVGVAPNGEWVKFEDIEDLKAQNRNLEIEVERLSAVVIAKNKILQDCWTQLAQ